MHNCKKLIEVAMPIKEISAASVHDKYIHHGHISTLHIWWARRPLPICRAVVFASLVPDPLDEDCPQIFKDAIEILLGKSNNVGDPYRPYEDIPFTAALDKMDDNHRNRLLTFIGKFSDEFISNEKTGKVTAVGNQISDHSLIKWENKSNEVILNKARKLIWVAHNCSNIENAISAQGLLDEFDKYYLAIKLAEDRLYSLRNRHLNLKDNTLLIDKLGKALKNFLERMPKTFDPFAGGGAIPLEAARLGCRSFGNDLNPVANIIQRGSLEFPQKFGKPIIYSKSEFIKLYGENEFNVLPYENKIVSNGEVVSITINNRLSFDVEFYAKKTLKLAEKEIGHLYPKDKKGNSPIVYYWTKVAKCSNPTCNAEVPLLRQFYLCYKKNKKIYLNPLLNQNKIDFEIKSGDYALEGWNSRGNLRCPCCGNITDVKNVKDQIIKGKISDRLIAVIFENKNGKEYRLPTKDELNSVNILPEKIYTPDEDMQRNSAGGDTFGWGINKWGQLFSKRQLLALNTLVDKVNEIKKELNANESEYERAIITYLGLWIDRIASYLTSFGRWIPQNEQLTTIFGRQAIAMVFDYPEVSIFSPTTSGALNQLEWITLYLNSENTNPFISICNNAASGEKEQFPKKSITAVITDPPYYDSIAYADLSDFFYVWLKRTFQIYIQ